MKNLTLPLGVLLLVGSGSLAAQDEPAPYLDEGADTFPLHEFGATGTPPYEQLIEGDITRGGAVDLAFLLDGIPVLLSEPGNIYAPLIFPVADASAITVLPGLGQNGLDELLIARGDRMVAIGRDYTRSPSTFTAPREVGRRVAWMRSPRIRTAHLDGNDDIDVYGLHLSRTLCLQLPDAEFASSGDEEFFVIPWLAEDVLAFRRDANDTKLSFAFLTQDGLAISDWNGNFDALLPADSPPGAIALVPDPAGFDGIAWVRRDASSGKDVLQTYRNGALGTAVTLGDLQTVGLASGDYDRDGDTDLILSHRSGYSIEYLRNQAGSFTLTASYAVAPLGTSAVANRSNPALVDLDNDGDLDIVFPVEATREMYTRFNDEIAASASHPFLAFGLDKTKYVTQQWGDDHYGTLELAISRHDVSVPGGATHVQLRCWRRQDIQTATEASPYELQLFDLSTVPEEGDYLHEVVLEEEQSPLPTPAADLESVYFIQLRFVHAVGDPGNETIVEAFPTNLYAFTTDDPIESTVVLDWILGFDDPWVTIQPTQIDVWVDGVLQSGGGGGGSTTNNGPQPPPTNDGNNGDDED